MLKNKVINKAYHKATYSSARLSFLALAAMLGLLGLGLFPAVTQAAPAFANDSFAEAYNANPNLWGAPGQVLDETYLNTKTGQRQVQYFDKGRMEMTYPDQLPNFVGDGKLVTEMVTGRMQVGDGLFWQYDGAEIPVAGGTTFAANPQSPSYRSFQSLTRATPSRVGSPVNAVLNPPEDEGFFLGIYLLSVDNALGSLSKYAAYIPETSHNIPDVFWSYLNQKQANGLPAFNWQTVFGLPITDAYWAKVRDGEKVSDVLVQLFERRTLLFNPANPAGLQVDSGNVGRDYYRWRYELPELPVVDSQMNPPGTTANARVTPELGESGTTFNLHAQGFKAGETVDVYARATPDGGVYSLDPFSADSKGEINRKVVTTPLLTPTQERYYVLTGRTSGVSAIWHFKIIGSIRYTPAVEAAQPDTVPDGLNAVIDHKVMRVGESFRLSATGFLPDEAVEGWVTTPLNRVVSWGSRVSIGKGNIPVPGSSSSSYADAEGALHIYLTAPGTAEPGIYAFTLYGTQSKHSAIAYFRVKTGSVELYNPFWGEALSFGPEAVASSKGVDLASLTEQRSQYRKLNLATEPAN